MRFRIHPFRRVLPIAAAALMALLGAGMLAPIAHAQQPLEPTGELPRAVEHRPGGEANLVIPDLSQVTFLGIPGDTLLMLGLIVCAAGLLFGLALGAAALRIAGGIFPERGPNLTHILATVFFAISVFFVYRSFYGMRIERQ